MKFIKSTLLAAAISAASFGAHAATVDLGDITDIVSVGHGVHGVGLFNDTYTFSLSAARDFQAGLFNYSFSNAGNTISNFWASISEDDFGLIGAVNITNSVEFASYILPAGDYTINLSGDFGDGFGGAYALGAQVLAPVPEPSTLGLMFGGLGLVGLLAYRSRKA